MSRLLQVHAQKLASIRHHDELSLELGALRAWEEERLKLQELQELARQQQVRGRGARGRTVLATTQGTATWRTARQGSAPT